MRLRLCMGERKQCAKKAKRIDAHMYRFSSGAYVSLIAAPMIALGDTGDVGRRTGMYMSVLATGAVAGPPISGAISTATGGYTAVGVYAGSSTNSGSEEILN